MGCVGGRGGDEGGGGGGVGRIRVNQPNGQIPSCVISPDPSGSAVSAGNLHARSLP
ncbi:MAG: hypothetical protein J7M25_15680 [Deltaproteobacteria bacterium]|nr:hypothetical protein [Deltaproteobacteria bacterium]